LNQSTDEDSDCLEDLEDPIAEMLAIRASLKIGCEKISQREAQDKELPSYRAPAHECPEEVILVDLTRQARPVFHLKLQIKSPSPKSMAKKFVTPRSKRILQENQT